MAKKKATKSLNKDELVKDLQEAGGVEGMDWAALLAKWGPFLGNVLLQILQRLQADGAMRGAKKHCPREVVEKLHQAQHDLVDALCAVTCSLECVAEDLDEDE